MWELLAFEYVKISADNKTSFEKFEKMFGGTELEDGVK